MGLDWDIIGIGLECELKFVGNRGDVGGMVMLFPFLQEDGARTMMRIRAAQR